MAEALRIDTHTLFRRHPFAREILCRLTHAGHEALLNGGVVRDGVQSLLDPGRPFCPTDVDIATSAVPDEVRRLFRDRPVVGVGEAFGVLVVVGPDGTAYEIATFRSEGSYDGRWPGTVRLVGDAATDVQRRDLTINGLLATSDGTVVDLVGGVDDLRAGRIRAIGNPRSRFREDHLRMLRAVRFACQIGAEIEEATAEAIRSEAASISGVSQERVRDELLRTLGTDQSARGVRLLGELGLLRFVLPEVAALAGVPQPEAYHPEGDVYVHTLLALGVADGFIREPLVKLAILLHDVGKPYALERANGANMAGHCAVGARMVERIACRLRLSRPEVARVVFLVKNHMRIADLPEMGRGKQVRFVSEGEIPGEVSIPRRFPLFFDLLELLIADCEASAHRASGWSPILRETLRIVQHIDRVGSLARARSLVDGHDLVALGMEPGAALGRVLERLHDRILAGEISSREAALAEAAEAVAREEGRT